MPARSRIIERHEPRGFATNGLSSSGVGEFQRLGFSAVDDVTGGNADNLTFVVTKYDLEGGRINYHAGNTQFVNYYSNWCCTRANHEHISLFGIPSNAVFAARTAARTNPSRPYVDIGVNVLEMADIARLIQKTGRNLFKELARNNLRYNFGIAPLIGDLAKLVNFQNQLSRRVRELKRLQGPRGFRKTVDLGEWSDSVDDVKTVQTLYLTFNQKIIKKTKLVVRGHARWRAGTAFNKLDDKEMGDLARKAVLGLTLDSSTLWEAFPFSWLIDWATNMGDLLKAHRNIVPASLISIRIMRHTHTDTYGEAKTYQNGSLEAAKGLYITKSRVGVPLTPSAHFPLLNGKQMGILASLAIMRA